MERVTDYDSVVNALLLTDVCMISAVRQDISAVRAAVAGWTDDERAAAYEWAGLEHLAVDNNDEVQRVPCPPHVEILRPRYETPE